MTHLRCDVIGRSLDASGCQQAHGAIRIQDVRSFMLALEAMTARIYIMGKSSMRGVGRVAPTGNLEPNSTVPEGFEVGTAEGILGPEIRRSPTRYSYARAAHVRRGGKHPKTCRVQTAARIGNSARQTDKQTASGPIARSIR